MRTSSAHEPPASGWIAALASASVGGLSFLFVLHVCDPSSPHFDDMRDGWLNGKYHDMRFKRLDVDAHMDARLVIE